MKLFSRTLACLLVMCLCAPLWAHADLPTYEGPGWDTPEEAVAFYLEGLKEQDIGKMISAYAVETYIDHFDLTAQLARIRAYTLSLVPRMPNTGDLLRAINIEARKDEIVRATLYQITAICLPGQDFTRVTTLSGENDNQDAKEFVEGLEKAFGAMDFGTLDVLLFVPSEVLSEHYASEGNQENLKRQIAPTGADEVRSVVAVFTVSNKACALLCDVMRYGDRWFMFKPIGNIASLLGLDPITGGVISMSKRELLGLWDELDADTRNEFAELLGTSDLLRLLVE